MKLELVGARQAIRRREDDRGMKAVKKPLAALLAAVLTLVLAGCGGGAETPLLLDGDFQKNMHQSTTNNLKYICETGEGIYFQDFDVFAYYLDKETKRVAILCGKPDCKHNNETCNAWFYTKCLWAYDGKIDFSNSDYIESNGKWVDYGNRLYSVNPDGTNRTVVQNLDFVPGGNTERERTDPIMHRGITYFTYSGILYALPLGGDIKDAERIWGEELEEDPSHSLIFNQLHYTLWADGETMYFMVNKPQSDGTNKDTLFAYDTNTREVSQVWETPNADEAGEWETAGVAVSQWYITDGYIYFYLSGNGFWRSDLESGATEKLADITETPAAGSAIFTDDYLFIMNDTPVNLDAFASYGTRRAGGDTIYVYSMEGKLIKELSLKALYGKLETITHCELAFSTGSDIYFIVDASTQGSLVNGEVPHYRNLFLYCVNTDTGEITQIYNWQ